MPQMQLRLQELLEHSKVQVNKEAISWYSTANALQDGNGFSGQDESCLRYLHLPGNLDDVHFDLNLRHPDEDFQLQKYDRTENISDMLSWVKEFGNQDNRFAEAEFIGHGHQLASMLTIPFESMKHISLHVEFFGGKFYFRRILDEGNFERLAECLYDPRNAYLAMRTKQGLKLNSYLLSGSPSGKPNPARPIKCINGRRIILKSTVGEHRLLYASAFKCIDKADDLGNLDQATITGIRSIGGENSSFINRNKWMDWWSHSILGKVNRTVIAYLPHPENGIVSKLEIVKLQDMFHMLQNSRVRRGGNSFLVPQENACFSCLDEILTFIKTTMSSASDGDKFELRHDKSNLGVIGLRKIYNTSKLEVVPAWFKEWVSSNRSTQQA